MKRRAFAYFECARHLDQVGEIVLWQGTVEDIDGLVAALGRADELFPSAGHVADRHGAEDIRLERCSATTGWLGLRRCHAISTTGRDSRFFAKLRTTRQASD